MYSVHVNMMTLFISEPQKGSETSCEYAGQSSKCSSRIGRMSKTALFFVGAKLQTMHVLYVRCFNKKRFPSLFYCLSS